MSAEEEYDDFDDEDDIPFASPEIQANYEAALGRFILEFNRVDNLLTQIIATILGRLKRPELVADCTSREFSRKLLVFDLLKSSTEGQGIKDIVVPSLREIAHERNKLAHGHFDQNPYDGSYEVVTKSTRSEYPVEKLNALTEKTNKLWESLRYAEAFYTFRDVVVLESAAGKNPQP